MPFTIHHACTGCTACALQCPTAAISGEPHHLHAIRPELCIECGVCGMVCPEDGAVHDGEGRPAIHIPRSLRPKPVFDPESCNGCGACVDRCPFGVIELEGPPFRGAAILRHPDACVSCGECEAACSKGAVRLFPLHG
ncbi:MAG: 4Fe-4S dicluster domain-containing protein [Myxococcota bacterium]